MKRYEFHSDLTPELVFARLDTSTKRGRDHSVQAPEEFIYDRKGERFCLGYSGVVPARGFVPFCGTIRAEGTGSAITGGFSLLREAGIPFAAVYGLFWAAGLYFGQPPIPFLLLNAAWLLIMFCFCSAVQLVFFGNRRKIILKFIEDNLLK